MKYATERPKPTVEGGGRRRSPSSRSAAGFALPVAIFALVVVGVLVTGGFFLAQQETRIGMASKNATQAVYVAEEGLSQVVLNWSANGYHQMATWSPATESGSVDGGTWTAEILRTSPEMFFVRSTGTVTDGGAMYSGASRQVGQVLRIVIPDIVPPAALATVDTLNVGGNATIQGTDTDPVAWGGTCSGGTEDKPGILTNDSTAIDESGGALTVDGDPPISEDATMTSDSLLSFGDLTFAELASMADQTYPGSPSLTQFEPDSMETSAGSGVWECDPDPASGEDNWGDPLNSGTACFDYFPIIYAPENLSINASDSGQGILLVENDLNIAGGFEFYGIVIVQGSFTTSGTGGHVNGGVIAANANLDPTVVTGNAVVTNSSCAATRAIQNNTAFTQPNPLSQRSWVDMTSLTYTY